MRLTELDLTAFAKPAAAALRRRAPGVATTLAEGRATFRLLLGGRLALFAVADALLLLSGFLSAAIEGARPAKLLVQVVLVPAFLLGVPALADLVAVERRSGSLDLALTVPSPFAFFVRRGSWVAGLLAAQGMAVLSVAALGVLGRASLDLLWAEGPAIGRAVVQTAVVALVLLAASLFWAVRLRSAGAVALATAASLALLLPWIAASPELEPESPNDHFLGIPGPLLDWLGAIAVLLGVALVLTLAARDRLSRPGRMLG